MLTQREVADEEGEELDGDDPILAMTDEWKEFFAKSEARRRLGKYLFCNTYFVALFIFLSSDLQLLIFTWVIYRKTADEK